MTWTAAIRPALVACLMGAQAGPAIAQTARGAA